MAQRVAVATSDSSAGCLKVSKVADKVIDFNPQLLGWPAPRARDFGTFIAKRAQAIATDPCLSSWDWTTDRCSPMESEITTALLRDSSRIELWIDAGPDGQLKMLLFLWWLAELGGLSEKLFLRHGQVYFGEHNAAWTSVCAPPAVPISDAELRYAAGAWEAWMSPTPERWRGILDEPVVAFPRLKLSVWETLCWLPTPGCGLTDLEDDILWLIRNGVSTSNAVMIAQARSRRGPFSERGSALVRLANGEMPAIEGIDEQAFDLPLLEQRERRERFDNATLSLTAFGLKVLKGEADYLAHNRIDRWWGGTHLAPDNLWRFDRETGKLCPPKSQKTGRARGVPGSYLRG